MQLTVAQIFIVRKVLTQTNEMGPDGRIVLKTFNGLDFSACRWFIKNTEEIMAKYQELLDTKREKLNKKFEKEREEEKGVLSKLKEYVKNLDLSKEESKKDRKVVELATQIISSNSSNNKVLEELGKDKDLNAAFKETKHEVEIKPKTMDLLKREFKDYEFSINSDIEIADVIDLFIDEKTEEKKGE